MLHSFTSHCDLSEFASFRESEVLAERSCPESRDPPCLVLNACRRSEVGEMHRKSGGPLSSHALCQVSIRFAKEKRDVEEERIGLTVDVPSMEHG